MEDDEHIQPRRNKAGQNLWVKKVLATVVVLLVVAFAAILEFLPEHTSSMEQSSTTANTHAGLRKEPSTTQSVDAAGSRSSTSGGTMEPRSQQGGAAPSPPRPQLTTPKATPLPSTTPIGQSRTTAMTGADATPSLLPSRPSPTRSAGAPSSAKAANLGANGAGATAIADGAEDGAGKSLVGGDFDAWLKNPLFQIEIALGALFVGGLFSIVGCRFWHELFVATLAVVVASATCYAASACGLAPNLFFVMGLMLHVVVATGFVVQAGLDGFQTLFGAILGFALAYGAGNWARNLVPGVALVWYQAGAIFGMAAYKVFHKAVLVMLTPILGGLLISSGLGSLAGRLLPLTWLPPQDASWLHAVNTLLGGAELGLSSLCLQFGSALLGGLLIGYSGRLWIALVYPLASICMGSLVTITCSSCALSAGTLECKKLVDWHWTLVGVPAWAVLATASAWYQVGQISRRDLHGSMDAHVPADSPGQSPRQASPGPNKAEVLRYTPSSTSSKNAEVPRYTSASVTHSSSFSLMKEPLSPKNAELPRYGSASAALSARTGPTSRPPTSRKTPRDIEGYDPYASTSHLNRTM